MKGETDKLKERVTEVHSGKKRRGIQQRKT